MKFRTQGHCVYENTYHIILVSKYHHKIFNNGVFLYMMKSLEEFHAYIPDVEILEANHDKDHIHFLISIAPKYSVSSIIRKLKLNTAKNLKDKFNHIKKAYWGIGGIWSDGYFCTTIGINEDMIRRYIKRQGEQDRGQAKLEL